MATADVTGDTAADASAESAAAAGAGGVDVDRLADKVYKLMVADLRLGLARGEGLTQSTGSRA